MAKRKEKLSVGGMVTNSATTTLCNPLWGFRVLLLLGRTGRLFAYKRMFLCYTVKSAASGGVFFSRVLLTPNQKDSQLACMRGGRSDVGVPSCLVDKLAATEGQ